MTGANFSECKKFRYSLYRIWDETLPKVMCIGLNPSTANADTDDPTIRNCRTALMKLGYGGLVMVNCFPIISSDPDILKGTDINNLENTINEFIIGDQAQSCDEVIFAWGKPKIVTGTGINKRWEGMFPNAKCFGKNKDGTPFHPLFLMYSGKIKNPELINYF